MRSFRPSHRWPLFGLLSLALPLLAFGLGRSPPTQTSSSPVVFTGSVTDSATGAAVAGAQVTIVGTTVGNLTTSAGIYWIRAERSQLPGDSVTLRAEFIGFRALELRVAVAADTVSTDFTLSPSQVQLEYLIVEGQRNPLRDRTASASVAYNLAQTGIRGSQALLFAQDYTGQHPDWNTESYDRIYENAFESARTNPLSTFSIDVDRASYSNVRRYLESGRRPPPDAVRVEELVNYFPYDYPEPDSEHPFTVTTEIGVAPWQESHRLLRIGLKGRSVAAADLPASNLVFLIDVSGSMRSANKLPLVKESLRLLVQQLRPVDRIAMVVYAGAPGLVLGPTLGNHKTVILAALDRLQAGGTTAGGAGLRLAYKTAEASFNDDGLNRVVLATDGDFNIGPSSDAEMTRLIEEKRETGISISVLGFGMGNLKDSKMEKIADKGNGNYAYIDNLSEARKQLVGEMAGTLFTIAKDVKIQIEFNPALVRAYRLLGYENRLLAAEDFDDDTKDAGELGAGHTVTALYELIPVGVTSDVDVRELDSLRYSTTVVRPEARATAELGLVKLRYKDPKGSESRLLSQTIQNREGSPSVDFRFASSVAGFGMLLRESEYVGDFSVSDVLSLAQSSEGEDPYGYRAGFIQLVKQLDQVDRTVASGAAE